MPMWFLTSWTTNEAAIARLEERAKLYVYKARGEISLRTLATSEDITAVPS